MALITCPDCGRQVSDRAESCPQCGCPLAGGADIVGGRRVRTVERTSKWYKGVGAVGCLMLLVGVMALVSTWEVGAGSPTPWPTLTATVGLAVLLYAKIGGWWHHG